jgi:hypothetical protein
MADEKQQVTEEQFAAAVVPGEGDSVVVNLDGIAEAKFENIPKGLYNFEIDTVEFAHSQNTNAPMLVLWNRVTDGDYVNRKLPYYLTFSQKALPFTKAACMKLAPDVFGQAGVNLKQIADGGVLLGKTFRARVGIKEYEGQDRSNITQILPPQTDGAGQAAAKFA